MWALTFFMSDNETNSRFIFFFLSLTPMLFAANYYVAATGDNGNAGSRAQPWASIQYAVNQAVAGDTIFVRGGVYNESVTFPRSGSEAGWATGN